MFRLFLCLIALGTFAAAGAQTTRDYIRNHAVAGRDGRIPMDAVDEAASKRLVLIGEMHGTNEMPTLAGQIIAGLEVKGPIAVGVEFPIDLQGRMDRFMESGDEKILRDSNFFETSTMGRGAPRRR